jgi:hypothetical protein
VHKSVIEATALNRQVRIAFMGRRSVPDHPKINGEPRGEAGFASWTPRLMRYYFVVDGPDTGRYPADSNPGA